MAQKDIAALRSQAQEIKNETTTGANTASRVGSMQEDQNDSAINAVETANQSLESNLLGKKQITVEGGLLTFTATPIFDFNSGGNVQEMPVTGAVTSIEITGQKKAGSYSVLLKNAGAGPYSLPTLGASFGTMTTNSVQALDGSSNIMNIIDIRTTVSLITGNPIVVYSIETVDLT